MANKKITDLMSGTPVRDSLLESAIDISGTMDSRKVKAGAVADLASANVAAPYDTTVTYAIGQYCLYEGDIYRCIAITTGAFDSTKWTQIVVTGEFRRVVELTSAQYTALSSAEKNNGTLYVITDEETTASDISYDNTSSGLTADDLQEAVDEVASLANHATDSLLKVVTFPNSASISIAANSAVNITANDMNISTPTGYKPIAIATIYCTSNDIVMRSFNCYATGTSSFGVARNVSGNAVSAIFNCAILYAKTGAVV